jgi:hypothetical protein
MHTKASKKGIVNAIVSACGVMTYIVCGPTSTVVGHQGVARRLQLLEQPAGTRVELTLSSAYRALLLLLLPPLLLPPMVQQMLLLI